MTPKDMQITPIYSETLFGIPELTQLAIEYKSGIVRRANIDGDKSEITFEAANGESVCVNVSKHVKLDVTFLCAYGISITDDGLHFFVQSWEHGLFCFALKTGALIWHHDRPKATDLVISKDRVICRFYNQQIVAFLVSTGAILATYPLCYDSVFIPLSQHRMLVGPKRKRYMILDEDLCQIGCIPASKLNPNAFETFLIQEVNLVDGGWLITGIEYSDEALIQARKSNTLSQLVEAGSFSRFVPTPADME